VKDVSDIAEDFAELYFEEKYVDEDGEIPLYDTVVGGLEPVSGTVLELSNQNFDSVKPSVVNRHLYKNNAESLPEVFGSRPSQESLEMVERVLEHGVSESDSVYRIENRKRSPFDISNYSNEDHELILEAAGIADLEVRKARFWGMDEEVEDSSEYSLEEV